MSPRSVESTLLRRRNAVTISAGIKLGIFTLTSILVTGLLAVIMGNVGLGDSREYSAIFASASNLQKGDDVRVAGVNVGEVSGVEHHDRTMAKVTFTVETGVELTSASTAEIRFLNLIGDRYLALEEGSESDGAQTLDEGDTIPVSNTSPSLDLTVLFNGFKPLFQALAPEQVNELSMNLVQVLQGEGGTVRGLLEHTASLTSTLADRDELIGDVVTNLSETLNTVNERHEQLSSLVVELKNWMTDLAADRETIGSSLGNISALTQTVADLIKRGRPLLKKDIAALHDLAKLLNRPGQRAELVDLLERMPEVMEDQARTGSYGAWYQYYICGVSARVRLPLIGEIPIIKTIQDYIENFNIKSTAERCHR